jgi:hypothetical protein
VNSSSAASAVEIPAVEKKLNQTDQTKIGDEDHQRTEFTTHGAEQGGTHDGNGGHCCSIRSDVWFGRDGLMSV